jgi:NADH:ubiquinone oxidoreductase subunit F (NADH-binding)
MERAPHLMIEGLLIGAEVVGASEATIFLRHEYHEAGARIASELERCRGLGLIGGSGVEVRLFHSPGGYICGEETALLEALEGKRAEPRNKPPFPGTHGLWGKPTLINNVETLSFVPAIMLRGAEWFRSHGQREAVGPKLLALSGDVQQPGVYEVALGITAAELFEECGRGMLPGRTLKAFMPGGASSGFLPASMADTALDFAPLAKLGSMLGSGAVIAIAEDRCILDLALNVVRFFRNESCGKCVPCRTGSEHLVRILEGFRCGTGGQPEIELIADLAETMQLTSICGLGQVAAAPITSALKYFPEEILAHVRERRCPAGVCALRN